MGSEPQIAQSISISGCGLDGARVSSDLRPQDADLGRQKDEPMIKVMPALEPWLICLAHLLLSYRVTFNTRAHLPPPQRPATQFRSHAKHPDCLLGALPSDKPKTVYYRTAKLLVVVHQCDCEARWNRSDCRGDKVQRRLVRNLIAQYLLNQLSDVVRSFHFSVRQIA